MKYFISIITLISLLACKAQSSIEPRYKSTDFGSEDVYYKDTNNDYNTFEGTWLYTSGDTSFKIVLIKKEMMHIQHSFSNYYTDALVGEYQYIEDSIEKVNSLDNLDQDYNIPYTYNIAGGSISKYGDPLCNDCEESDEKKISCALDEPDCEDGPMTNFILRYYIEDGIEKIHCRFWPSSAPHQSLESDEEPECTSYKVPYGEYIFVKQ